MICTKKTTNFLSFLSNFFFDTIVFSPMIPHKDPWLHYIFCQLLLLLSINRLLFFPVKSFKSFRLPLFDVDLLENPKKIGIWKRVTLRDLLFWKTERLIMGFFQWKLKNYDTTFPIFNVCTTFNGFTNFIFKGRSLRKEYFSNIFQNSLQAVCFTWKTFLQSNFSFPHLDNFLGNLHDIFVVVLTEKLLGR